MEGLASVCPIDAELADRIKRMEQIDDMCALTPVRRNGPSDMDIQGILEAGREVAGFAKQHVPWEDMEFVAVKKYDPKSGGELHEVNVDIAS